MRIPEVRKWSLLMGLGFGVVCCIYIDRVFVRRQREKKLASTRFSRFGPSFSLCVWYVRTSPEDKPDVR